MVSHDDLVRAAIKLSEDCFRHLVGTWNRHFQVSSLPVRIKADAPPKGCSLIQRERELTGVLDMLDALGYLSEPFDRLYPWLLLHVHMDSQTPLS